MYNFLKNRLHIYGSFYGFYINNFFYILILYTIYHNNVMAFVIIILFKELWHYLILHSFTSSKKNFNYHVYQGVNILLTDINKRRGILMFYVTMYYLLLSMIIYLLFVKDTIGIVLGSFVYISNLLLSLIFYKLSTSYK